jgi:bifunctional non-homologous end joining protein LigD
MLDEYKRKRNFKVTPEPDGNKKTLSNNYNLSKPKPRFVIQKHEATRLHYDFRLESFTENVLVSWAIPKGPSLDPSKKRLAIQTEDHPLDYLLFEGVIPEGNYGAGTVIVWDTGEYSIQRNTSSEPTTKKYARVSEFDEDVSELVRKNDKITFTLYGQKLRGMFSLIRIKSENQWLLIKLNDEFANGFSNKDKNNDMDITEISPESVLTGKTNKEILEYKHEKSSLKNNIKDQGYVTNYPSTETTTSSDTSPPPNTNLDTKNLSLKQTLFESSKPMLSSLADKPFNNKNWIFEIKWDGVRAITLVNIQDSSVFIRSRSGDIITHRYPELEKTLKLAFNEEIIKDFAILDGEIVVLDKEGYPNFQNHQKRMNIDSLKSIEVLSNLYPAVYYVFDILYLDNDNLKELPFVERKKILSSLIKRENDKIRLSDYVEEFGVNVFEAIKNMNLEGVIAKHKSSKYYSGLRSKDWLKIKNIKTQDCIVIGYTRGEGNRRDYFGSLLLAAIDNNNNDNQDNIHLKTNEINGFSQDTNQLRFIGHTGSGFDFENLPIIHQKLREIEISYCPIRNVPYLNRETVWVKPITVIEVKFNDWTNNKIMRAPIFLRIRKDKPPSQCIIEISNKTSNNSASPKKNESQFNGDGKKVENFSQVTKPFSHLKKEFWKATKDHPAITKGDLIDYYDKMSIYLLPFLQDRPLSLSRYPDGIYGKAFYQKDWKFDKPTYVKTVQIYSESNDDEKINYIVCNNNETLLWLVNLGCIEIHPWNSRVNDYSQCNKIDKIETQECGLNYPDFIVFDLDPYINIDNENSSKEPIYSLKAFKQTVEVAYSLRDIFDELNIRSFVKTSGKTGLHIFLPIINLYSFKQSREFAKIISQILKKRMPGKITTEWKTTDRKGMVFFDYNQNSLGKTLASIFSARPIENAPVSVPLKWEELSDIIPTDFTITTVPDIYKRKINPWKDILSYRQNLEEILEGISDFKV